MSDEAEETWWSHQRAAAENRVKKKPGRSWVAPAGSALEKSVESAHRLAVLALQSKRYSDDPEYRDAVEAVLSWSLKPRKRGCASSTQRSQCSRTTSPATLLAKVPGMLALADGVRAQRWPHTIDARVWADEWAKTLAAHPGIASDRDCMIGWFANAIMAGYDTAAARSANDAEVSDGV